MQITHRVRLRQAFPRLVLCGTAVLAAWICSTLHAQAPALPPEPTAAQADANVLANNGTAEEQGVEYITRGPLHEAFATPYSADPEPAMLVLKQPPEAIKEIPPDLQPKGHNVQWIAGYWDWDAEREDFIWISGLWRDIPPAARWIPGYWAEVDDGFQRVSGFWSKGEQEEIAYLPVPPKSLEQGPSAQPPSDNHFYIPGCWVYQSDDYAWRPGFWTAGQEQWVWIPASYLWTPRGYVYQQGYWDYEPTYRGTVFTPVYYSQPVYRQPHYRYRPRYVIDTNLALLVHLFIGPQHRNYYYGNYYDARYRNGYRPWVDYRHKRDRWSYDPLYSYYGGTRRGQQNVIQWAGQRYDYFQDNERYRPAPTVRAQQALLASLSGGGTDAVVQQLARVARDIQDPAAVADPTLSFNRLSGQQQTRIDALLDSQQSVAKARLQFETRAKAAAEAANANVDAAANVDANVDAAVDRARQAAGRASLRLPAMIPNIGAASDAVDRAGNAASRARDAASQARDAAGPAGDRIRQQLDRLPGNVIPGNVIPGNTNPGNVIPGLDNRLPGQQGRGGNRSGNLPQLRRPFSDRSNMLPGIPGLPDSQPQPLRSNRPNFERPNLQRSLPAGGNLPGLGSGNRSDRGNVPGRSNLPGGDRLPGGVKLPRGVKIPGL